MSAPKTIDALSQVAGHVLCVINTQMTLANIGWYEMAGGFFYSIETAENNDERRIKIKPIGWPANAAVYILMKADKSSWKPMGGSIYAPHLQQVFGPSMRHFVYYPDPRGCITLRSDAKGVQAGDEAIRKAARQIRPELVLV